MGVSYGKGSFAGRKIKQEAFTKEELSKAKDQFMHVVDNAIIMAAGSSSRFAPLSREIPKALLEVKGEILIERQIKQLQAAGIKDIIVVVGYKQEKFTYLKDKFQVELVENPDYLTRNNNSSIYAVRDLLANSYICSADNYFSHNPFESEVEESYYAGVWAEGVTEEWCMEVDADDYIKQIKVGGKDQWIMLGHSFWSASFSRRFVEILVENYARPETKPKYWENILAENLAVLPMQIRRYPAQEIYEFDSLAELRDFDASYVNNTRSKLLKNIAKKLGAGEADIVDIKAVKGKESTATGFTFSLGKARYQYDYAKAELRQVNG